MGDFAQASTTIIFVIFGLVTVTIFALTFVPRYQNWAAERYARSVALMIAPELRAAIAARLMRRTRGVTIGAVVGAVVALALLSSDPRYSAGLGVLVLVGIAFAGMAVGAALTATVTATRLQADGPRYARAEAVGIGDYVAPIERLGARIMVALSAAAFLGTLAVKSASNGDASAASFGSGSLTALSILALALFEISGRWLVRQGQPAGSPHQLSWDDALRAGLLRDIVTAPLTLGACGFILGFADLFGGLATTGLDRTAGLVGVNVVGYVLTIGIVLVAIFAIVSKPQQHFRRRLWPDLAEGLQ